MDITKALIFGYPGTEWTVGETYESLEWKDSIVSKPSKEDLEKAYQRYITKYSYIELRKKEYPSITDQLDLLYHNGYEGWKEEITKIKNKYPKP